MRLKSNIHKPKGVRETESLNEKVKSELAQEDPNNVEKVVSQNVEDSYDTSESRDTTQSDSEDSERALSQDVRVFGSGRSQRGNLGDMSGET